MKITETAASQKQTAGDLKKPDPADPKKILGILIDNESEIIESVPEAEQAGKCGCGRGGNCANSAKSGPQPGGEI